MSSQKIKIGVDARPLSYGITGNSRYLFEALKYLVREDSRYYFTLFCNKPIDSIFQPFLQENAGLLEVVCKRSIGFIWLHLFLPRLLRKHQIELFWGTLQLLPFRKLSIPSIVNYHDLNFISAPQTMARLNYHQHKLFSPRSLQNADRVLCLSENTKNEIINLQADWQEKLEVIYPGVALPEVNHKGTAMKELPELYFFTLGTLEPRKNIQTLINAYLKLKKEKPNLSYSLVIAGRKGWGEGELSERLFSGDLEEQGVYFIENPDEAYLDRLYVHASAFCFPSLHEGFGLPILEALIRQKVCLVSDIPVFREIVDSEIDFLLAAQDVGAWKNALAKLADMQNMQRKPAWDASQWTWNTTARKIESILDFYSKKETHAV
ncbi:MAG: glycosyltransferase family 1 protein [Spirochaetota bacterium]